MSSAAVSDMPGPAFIHGVDVDAVAATVQACAGVSGLDGGRFGEVVSYLPGRTVPGVVVSDRRVKVQVRSRWGIPAPQLAALITTVLAPLTRGKTVDVVIADIDDPPGTSRPPGPADRHTSERADRPGPAGAPGRFPLPS